MRAGQLKWRVTILRRSTDKDAIGQPVNQWVPVQTLWADVRYQSGLASLDADQLRAKVRASIRVRKSASSLSIKPGMRARVGQVDYAIAACLPQGRDAIDLVCEAV